MGALNSDRVPKAARQRYTNKRPISESNSIDHYSEPESNADEILDCVDERSDTSDSDQSFVEDTATPATSFSPGPSPRQPACRQKNLVCPYPGCDKSYNRPARLEEHKRSHTKERIFKCKEPGCSKDFLRASHLKRHTQLAHSEQRAHVCQWDDCGKTFGTAQHLKRHHAVHEGKEKHKCREPGCGQSFRKPNTLEKHHRTVHAKLPAYPCNEVLPDGSMCSRGFDSAHNLKVHKGREHGAQTHVCKLCQISHDGEGDRDVAFGTYNELQAHTKAVHPPTCTACGHRARTNKELLKHIEIRHSGIDVESRREHICHYPECDGKGFVKKSYLDIHIRSVHQGIKTFLCSVDSLPTLNNTPGWTGEDACGRAFAVKASLEEHIRIKHLGMDNSAKARKKRLGTWIEPSSRPKKRSKTTTLDLLTGTAYERPERNKPCPVMGCDFVFTREYDKWLHLQSKHGMSMDDEWLLTTGDGEFAVMQDSDYNPGSFEDDLEASARNGGPFWISHGPVDDSLLTFEPISNGGHINESFGLDLSQSEREVFGHEEEQYLPLDPALLDL